VGILDQMPPEAVDQMYEQMTSAQLDPMTIVMSLVIDPLFGLLGGLIGYAVYKPKAGTPPPQP
jgi:hypothetical protein